MHIPFIGDIQISKSWNIIIVLLALLYVVSPIDFIPDIIPVIGWIDDVLAIIVAVGALAGGMIHR